MKFRDKAFMVLFAVFIIIFHVGMWITLHYTYKEELNSIKSRAVGEAYFIRTSISQDMESVESSMSLTYETKKKIFESYSSYYEKNKIYLEIWNGTGIEYSNLPQSTEERKHVSFDPDQQIVSVQSFQDEKFLLVESYLAEPYQKYRLVYAYGLSDLLESQDQLLHLLIKADICIMLILAVILYIVLVRLMKPLKVLSNATQAIAKGDYEVRVPLHGKDEFAELGTKFEEMAGRIHENMEELTKEAEAKQRLIDNMAHELRTPLTSINGYADYLRMAQVDEDERLHALTYIVSESRRLERLSKAILSIADIRENELQGMKQIGINDLVESLTALFHNQKATITYEVNATCMWGNEEMIISLLSNLIENGIRASEENTTVHISFEENETLEIRVTDNGIGMSKEEILLIEEPFYRVDKARSRKSGGVGLGVSLCRQIVKAHHATMTYESEKGKGTTVVLVWPIKSFTTS